MASAKPIFRWPLKAHVDLSAKQYTLVTINESSELEAATSGVQAFVLSDTPKAGEYGTLSLVGVEKVKLGATVKAGDLVASDNSGKGQKAVSGQRVVGTALEAGEAEQLIPVLLAGAGAGKP